jgi:hypothetical protein
VTAYEARQVLPGAAPTPAKGGLLYVVDDATTKGTHTVGSACPATPPPAPSPGTGPAGTQTPPVDSGAGPIPAKLVTKRVKRAKALKLKLSSTEKLTAFGLQIRRGKKVFGKLAGRTLSGKATFKVKVSKLKKGTYTVDLAGTDAAGARRFGVAKLKVR